MSDMLYGTFHLDILSLGKISNEKSHICYMYAHSIMARYRKMFEMSPDEEDLFVASREAFELAVGLVDDTMEDGELDRIREWISKLQITMATNRKLKCHGPIEAMVLFAVINDMEIGTARVCEGCTKYFTTTKKREKYCSPYCRKNTNVKLYRDRQRAEKDSKNQNTEDFADAQ